MEISTLFSILKGTADLTEYVVQKIEKAKSEGVILTPEQQAILDQVNRLYKKVGL